MRRRLLVVAAGTLLAGAVGASPAWARADTTATEICGGATTAVVDTHAGTSLEFADTHFNRVAGVVLGMTCSTS